MKETGFYHLKLTEQGKSYPLFLGFPEDFEVFEWHGDVFDLPRGATLLATCQIRNQAFVIGRATYGLLFHLELTPEMVANMIEIDKEWLHKDNLVDEHVILEKSQAGETLGLCRKLFRNWLSL